MALEIELGTPQATNLQNVIQAKLMELGWITDNLDDTALAEYVMLMLANGEDREKVVSEIAEFIEVDGKDATVNDFSTWVFQQAEQIFGSQTSQAPSAAQQLGATLQNDGQTSTADAAVARPADDTEMGDTKDGHDPAIPTGPRSMRNTPQRGRGGRMLGQVHRAMDRSSDGGLHRIKGAAGRINSHSHDAPKGPTPRGPRATMQRFGGGSGRGAMNPHNMPMNQANQNNMFGTMSPHQQMQLFAMYEEQARMMAQILSPQQQQQILSNQMGVSPPQQQQPGKSLFERIENGPNADTQNLKQHAMGDTFSQGHTETTSSMEVESTPQDATKLEPNTTMCRFNLSCTKPDCPFVHQSPLAPPGTVVDMTDECAFGAACKNRKCTGKHPSPAKLAPQRAEQDCKYFPNCMNPHCPFRHPSMPACRNGADCTVQDCKFSHSKIVCKYDPCLNPSCPYKHAEGQKRGAYADKVWVNKTDGGEEVHLSERKFVDENAGEEELVRPGQGDQAATTTAATAADSVAI